MKKKKEFIIQHFTIAVHIYSDSRKQQKQKLKRKQL